MKKTSIAFAASILLIGSMGSLVSAASIEKSTDFNLVSHTESGVIVIDNNVKEIYEKMDVVQDYVKISDGHMVVDPLLQSIVTPLTYELFVKGANNINSAIDNGTLVVNADGTFTATGKEVEPVFTTYAFTNSYWWGNATTLTDSETKREIQALRRTATTSAFVAFIAALYPPARVAGIVAGLTNISWSSLADEMGYKNNGYGVTINHHIIGWPYIEVTTNTTYHGI